MHSYTLGITIWAGFCSMLKLLPSPFSFSVTHYSHIEQTSTTEKKHLFWQVAQLVGLCLWTSCLPSRRDVLGVSPQSSDHQIIFGKKKNTAGHWVGDHLWAWHKTLWAPTISTCGGTHQGSWMVLACSGCRDEDREIENWRELTAF